MSDPLAGQLINVDDYAATLDAHGEDIDSLNAQMASVASTTRLRGMNATMDGAIGAINPTVSQAFWQAESTPLTLDVNGYGVITFPAAFQLILLGVFLTNGDGNVSLFDYAVTEHRLDGFDVKCVDGATGAALSGTAVRINWFAVGL
jgi:hypothetical protein